MTRRYALWASSESKVQPTLLSPKFWSHGYLFPRLEPELELALLLAQVFS